MPEQTTTVINPDGTPFTVRLLQQGDKYGLNDCLTHEHAEPIIEFYDARYPHTEFGQFVSRYFVSSLADHVNYGHSLNLDGGIPEWYISSQNLRDAVYFFIPVD